MGVVVVEGEGAAVLGMNLGRPTVTSGDGDALFPDYFGGGLVFICAVIGREHSACDDDVTQWADTLTEETSSGATGQCNARFAI